MKRYLWLLCVLVIAFSACNLEQSGGTIFRSYDYDPNLKKAYRTAAKIENIRSLLVSHQDSLIGEGYFERFSSDSLEHVRSVTKSVMSTLIGIAIDEKIFQDIDESIAKYIPNTPLDKRQVTIRHLLTMTSGIQWSEGQGNSEFNRWVTSPNEMEYVLVKPVDHKPGTVWNYNSGAYHLLSVILTNASGMSTWEFAQKYLFQPIGIEETRWEKHADGYYNGGAGLELKPRDMIKIGQLYMNEGRANGKQVISNEYIIHATRIQQPNRAFEEDGYGYGWWIGGDKELDVQGYMAQGYGGQTILVIPKQKLIIVTTFRWRLNAQDASDQQDKAMNVVGAEVLKGILGD